MASNYSSAGKTSTMWNWGSDMPKSYFERITADDAQVVYGIGSAAANSLTAGHSGYVVGLNVYDSADYRTLAVKPRIKLYGQYDLNMGTYCPRGYEDACFGSDAAANYTGYATFEWFGATWDNSAY